MPKNYASERWRAGFNSGVTAALAVVAGMDGPTSTVYEEIVRNCGPAADLVRHAKRDGNYALSGLKAYMRDQRAREHGGQQ